MKLSLLWCCSCLFDFVSIVWQLDKQKIGSYSWVPKSYLVTRPTIIPALPCWDFDPINIWQNPNKWHHRGALSATVYLLMIPLVVTKVMRPTHVRALVAQLSASGSQMVKSSHTGEDKQCHHSTNLNSISPASTMQFCTSLCPCGSTGQLVIHSA